MIYETKGTCAKEIKLEVDRGTIRSVELCWGVPALPRHSAVCWWGCVWRTRLRS